MIGNEPTLFRKLDKDPADVKGILKTVYKALKEKGYDVKNQIVGYIMSGDPGYITSHNGARALIDNVERDEILEEFVDFYITNKLEKEQD